MHGEGPFHVSATAILPSAWLKGYQPLGDITPPKNVVHVTAEKSFWDSKAGILEIDVEDAAGAHRRLFVNVRPPGQTPVQPVLRRC
jgi:hypothetical protein